MTDMNSIVIVGAGIGLAVVLFLLLRSFVWWYFGISRHLENQERIIYELEIIAKTGVQSGQSQNQSASPTDFPARHQAR